MHTVIVIINQYQNLFRVYDLYDTTMNPHQRRSFCNSRAWHLRKASDSNWLQLLIGNEGFREFLIEDSFDSKDSTS